MSKKMKLVGCLVVVALLLVSLVMGAVAQEGSILDDILKRGVVRVGIGLAWPLIAFIDDNGNPAGYEVEMAKLLAEKLGVKIEIIDVSGPARISALVAKKVDIVISGFSRTLERVKSVAFMEIPYINTGLVYIVRPNSPYQTVEELQTAGNKVKIGYDRGGTAQFLAEKLFPNAQHVIFDNFPDALMALDNKVVDVGCTDSIGADSLMKARPGLIKRLPGIYTGDVLAAAVPYGDFKWWLWCNLFFYEFNTSGESARLYKKWVGVEPDPLIPWIRN